MSANTSPANSSSGAPALAPNYGEVTAAEPVNGSSLWWIGLVVGIVAAVVGVLIMAWPDATITVVAVLFGVNLLIAGLLRVLQAILTPAGGAAARVLYGLLGIVFIVIGVLCLRNLLQTVTVLVLLVGLSWLIGGIVEIIVALSSGSPSQWNARTALDVGTGIVALLAGLVVLAYPELAFGTLLVLLGVSLVVYGVVAVLNAFRLRAASA